MRSPHPVCLRMILFTSLVVGAVGGCLAERESRERLDLGVAPQRSPLEKSAAYRDTVGAYTYYEGLRPMKVRGYGVVVGLGTNGSRDCPRHVYDRLVQRLYKRHRFSSTLVGVDSIRPEQLIHDLDTAVVVIQAEIPPAAVTGTRFDVSVMALPGTQTKSLRGGRLYTVDLEVFRPVTQTTSIAGRVLALAAGPVFLNPFSTDESATRSTPLEGTVVGGGVAIQDRRIRLVLLEPSYQRARQIQDRINAHFPGPAKTADAISPSFVRLRIPREYHDDTAHFLGLVRSLYLSRDPKFEAVRARMLAEEITHSAAPHGQIASALEGLGRTALPVLDDLYTHPRDWVSFHAAAAGLRLGDHLAVDAMTAHARDAACEYRFRAIRGLAQSKGMAGAAMALRRLLHDRDPRAQIAAYEGLLQRGDRAVRSLRIGDDNFTLDQIPTESRNFIYVKRSGSRRIALFGKDMLCTPPVLYVAPDGSVTINAEPGDETLTVLRKVVATGTLAPPVAVPLELLPIIQLLGGEAEVGLDDEVLGLGLDYGAVTQVLYHLCKDRSINAEFILEQPNVAELFGPPRPATRPESEL